MKTKATGIQYKNSTGQLFSLNFSVLRDADNKIISGLTIGPVLEQNMASILIAEPGDFKNDLTLGVGLRSALMSEDLLEYRHAIKEQFAKDNLDVKHLNLYNLQNFEIDAEYES